MNRARALEIISEGFERMAGPVDLSAAGLIRHRDIAYSPDEIRISRNAIQSIDDDVSWAEFLHPKRTWIAATLIFDAGGQPYVAIDVGGLTNAVKSELAPGVDIAISAALDPRPLRIEESVADTAPA